MENINLIKKIANSFAVTTGLSYEDLFQEASLAYLEASRTYNPSRGKLSTHIWHCIHNHLKTYLKQENEYRGVLIPLIDFQPTEFIGTKETIEECIIERDIEDTSITNYISFVESLSPMIKMIDTFGYRPLGTKIRVTMEEIN